MSDPFHSEHSVSFVARSGTASEQPSGGDPRWLRCGYFIGRFATPVSHSEALRIVKPAEQRLIEQLASTSPPLSLHKPSAAYFSIKPTHQSRRHARWSNKAARREGTPNVSLIDVINDYKLILTRSYSSISLHPTWRCPVMLVDGAIDQRVTTRVVSTRVSNFSASCFAWSSGELV